MTQVGAARPSGSRGTRSLPELDPETLSRLRLLLGRRLATSQAIRDQHAQDESHWAPAPPHAVAFPVNSSEVVAIVEICAANDVPIVPFGAGTALEGHVQATSGGLSLDLTGLNKIVRVGVEDMDVTVEAGVTRKALAERLARDGLFFPVDPGADATLGGMAATGASGTTTVRYGAMRENVLSLKVVLPDGRLISTSRRARKSSAGYDLTRLFIGSEGTLGVITELTLRAYGIPEAISGAVCSFPDVAQAVRAVIMTLQLGIPVARIEFVDEVAINAINRFADLSYPEAPSLLLEFHGSETAVIEQAGQVGDVVRGFDAVDYTFTANNTERSRLWRARHDYFYASLALRPGCQAVITDVCVPISRLADCIVETRRDIDATPLTATIVGHVGDGNFHVMMLVDSESSGEMELARQINERLVERALDMDGTCTGEHGIGLGKMQFLRRELPEALDLMRAIKVAVDPQNIMNPGKVLQV